MLIERVPVASLLFDPSNARKHSQKNIDAIKSSLAKFGQQKVIVVDQDNIVLAGNGTLEAAKALGWTEIDIHRTPLKGPDAIAYGISDNRSGELAEWDIEPLSSHLEGLQADGWDLDDLGFSADDLEQLKIDLDDHEARQGLTDDDAVPNTDQNKFNVERGQIWQLGEHRLMCGDSTNKGDVEKLMAGEKADMVFTDPPYGVSYTDKNEFLNGIGKPITCVNPIEGDHQTVEQMYELWCKVFNMMCDHTTEKASYYVCSPQGGELMMMMMQAIDQSPFSLKHMIIWNKNNHVLGRCDYNYKYEPILYGWKKKGTHKFYGRGQCKTSVWNFNKPKKNDLHPTMKPVELCEEAILNSSQSNNGVLELFCGSGSTLIACEKTNRKCYGMEIDPHYCSVIIDRWQQFTGKEATLASR